MAFGVKIYNTDKTTKLYDIGFEEIRDINLNFDIFSNPDSIIEFQNPVDNLTQFMAIEVYETTDTVGVDRDLYDGIIYNFNIDINTFGLVCRPRKVLMERKVTLEQKIYNGVSIKNILDDITGEWNTKFSELWTHNGADFDNIPLTRDTTQFTFDTTSITFDATELGFNMNAVFEYGTSWYEILDEIANLTGLFWYLDGNQITFTTSLGEDKTDGVNFTELLYIRNDIELTNLNNARLVSYGQVTNFLIATSTTNTVQRQDNTSITQFGQVLGGIKQFYGSLSSNAIKYLSRYSVGQDVLEVETDPFTVDADIGDKVKLEIDGVNNYLDRVTSIFIITKNIQFRNGTKLVRLTGADTLIDKPTTEKRIKKLEGENRFLILKV